MKTTRILLGLVMLCGTVFGIPAPIITTTSTNGPTTVTVHARTTDGKLPVGVDCNIVINVRPDRGNPRPLSLVGKSGDWTATNVRPYDNYIIRLQSTNYAEDSHTSVDLQVLAGTNYNVDFVLPNGATFKGRVLDDATGKPIDHARINTATQPQYDILTDAEGRYSLAHIAGVFYMTAGATNYVWQSIKVDAAAENSTVSVPDILLQLCGWISGRVERPTEVASNAFALVAPDIQGSWPTNSGRGYTESDTNDTFRTGPLPPGTYSLRAMWLSDSTTGGPQKVLTDGSVSNINVIAGQETTNVFIPTKLTVQANSTGG